MFILPLQLSSLSSWGLFKGRQRKSDSPFIENIWEGIAQKSDIHITAADAAIDLVYIKRKGITGLLLSGPTSKAYLEHIEAGDEVLSIRLRTSVYLPFIVGTKLTDIDTFLPANKKHFVLHGNSIALPSFDNVEIFIEQLAAKNLLKRNIPLEYTLQNPSLYAGSRTMRRHCLATVGLTMNRIQQIKRAELARSRLSTGQSLTQITYDLGYSNPGHLTNTFKHFFGRTPSAFRRLLKDG